LGSALGGEKATGVATLSRAAHHGPSSSRRRTAGKSRKGGRIMGIERGEFNVAMYGERLGEEISEVEERRDIREVKQTLTDSIAEPVKSHIHRLGLFGSYSSVGKANGTLIITEEGGRGLGVTNILKGSAEETRNLGVAKGGGEFRLSGGGDYDRNTGG
jgi:hypothetical protein